MGPDHIYFDLFNPSFLSQVGRGIFVYLWLFIDLHSSKI